MSKKQILVGFLFIVTIWLIGIFPALQASLPWERVLIVLLIVVGAFGAVYGGLWAIRNSRLGMAIALVCNAILFGAGNVFASECLYIGKGSDMQCEFWLLGEVNMNLRWFSVICTVLVSFLGGIILFLQTKTKRKLLHILANGVVIVGIVLFLAGFMEIALRSNQVNSNQGYNLTQYQFETTQEVKAYLYVPYESTDKGTWFAFKDDPFLAQKFPAHTKLYQGSGCKTINNVTYIQVRNDRNVNGYVKESDLSKIG